MRTLWVVGLVLVAGCGARRPPRAEYNRDVSEVIARRARFDLNCEHVEVVQLTGREPYDTADAMTFGVRGCDRQVSYGVECPNYEPEDCYVGADAEAQARSHQRASEPPPSPPPQAYTPLP